MTDTTTLQQMYDQEGQSPWIDNLNRPSVLGGGLAALVAKGVRGVTSNPTIFEKAMTGSDAYDDQFADLIGKGSVDDAFWTMARTSPAPAGCSARCTTPATARTDS